MYTISLLLLILGTGAVAVILSSTIFFLKNSQVAGQIGGESETKIKKHDIFKIILTINGLGKDSGDVIAFVTVNGQSKVKLFDDKMSYLSSIGSSSGGQGFIEYVSTFPNTAIKTGEQYKACALLIRDSNLICQTGNNSPALRPETVDLYIKQGDEATTTTSTSTTINQALSIAGEKNEQNQ
jgi:hypothetical protein